MNTYIQNKLDEFDKLSKKAFPIEKHKCQMWNDDDEMQEETAVVYLGEVKDLFIQSLTDYHNHIVEKIEEWFEDKGTNMNFDILLSILQDTNQ